MDITATQCGHPHWNALTGEWDKGWRPSAQLLADFGEAEAAPTSPCGLFITEVTDGNIGDEPYELQVGFDDVLMGGRGWTVHLGHAASEARKYVACPHCSATPLDIHPSRWWEEDAA